MDKYYNQPIFYNGDYLICNKGSDNETSSYLIKYGINSWSDSDILAYGSGMASSFIVYNNKLYAIWSNSGLYVYNDDTHNWQSVCNDDIHGRLLICNNELYMAGFKSTVSSIYKFNFSGQTATCDATVAYPVNANYLDFTVLNNKIYTLSSSSYTYPTNIYRLDNTTWTDCGTLPYDYKSYGDAISVVTYNNKIHLLGSSRSETEALKHYSYDGTSWTREIDMPYIYYLGRTLVV